jgi:hypothetical protein
MKTWEEHLAWCKQRALEYIDRGDVMNGLTSMMSDIEKHPEGKEHAGNKTGVMLMLTGNLSSPYEARRFIEGYR